MKTFIEKTGSPFALLNNGRGVLPDNHPLCINDGGFTGIVTGAPQADVIIIAGIRLNWVLQSTRLFPDAKVVRMHPPGKMTRDGGTAAPASKRRRAGP